MPITEQARNRWALISLRDGIIDTDVFERRTGPALSSRNFMSPAARRLLADRELPARPGDPFARSEDFRKPGGFEITKVTNTTRGLIVEDVFEFTYVPETLEVSYEARYRKGEAAQDAISSSVQYVNNSVFSIQFSAIFHDAGSGRDVDSFIAMDQLLAFMVPKDAKGTLSVKGVPRKLLLSGPRLSLPFSRFEKKIVKGRFQQGAGPFLPFSSKLQNLTANNNNRLNINTTLTPVVLTKLDVDMSLFSSNESTRQPFGVFSGDFPKHIEVNLGFIVFVLPTEIKDHNISTVIRQ